MKKCTILFLTVLLVTSFSFSQVKKVRVIADKVFLYSNPKTKSDLIYIFEKGSILNVFGSGEKNGWYNVSGRSQRWGGVITGFVQASQVEVIDERPKAAREKDQPITEIEKAAKTQEIRKPEEEKPAKIEKPVKTQEIVKPELIPDIEKPIAPVAVEKKSGMKKLSIRLGYNAGFSTQSESVSWSKEIYYEDALFGINYGTKKGNSFNAGLGYKFSHSIGVELGVDIASRNLNANYDASIPHPLYFDSPREIQNTASYKITENAAFLNLVMTVPFSRFGLDIFAGPAYFFASAELIGAIQYSQSYPYSSVTISAKSQKFNKNVFGFNAGANLIFNFSQSMGIFLNGQYFTASADLKPAEVPGFKLSMGGLKAGGGIKISF
jgi:hypothetical protein